MMPTQISRAHFLLRVVAVLTALRAGSASAQGTGGGPCVMSTAVLLANGPGTGTAADQQAIRTQLTRVHEIVTAAPEVARRGNYRLSTVISGARVGVFSFSWSIAEGLRGGYYRLSIYAPETWGPGCTLAKYAGTDWTSQLFVAVNSTGPLMEETDPVIKDDSGWFYVEPRITGRVQGGFPVYDDRVVFVTHVGRSPFVPITVERYLRHFIGVYREGAATTGEFASSVAAGDTSAAAMQQGVSEIEETVKSMDAQADAMQATDPKTAAELRASAAKLRQQLPAMRETARVAGDSIRAQARRTAGTARAMLPEAQERFRRLEARLASLSPAERRAQAWYGGEGADPLLLLNRAGAPGAHALVTFNPDFFDRTAPRTAFQSLAFVALQNFSPTGGSPDDLLFARRLLDSIDFVRIGTLVR